MKRIYLDYASTTPVRTEVVEVMKTAYLSIKQTADIDSVSTLLKQTIKGHEKDQIFYMGSGSEANQSALMSLTKSSQLKKGKVLLSAIEHPSVRRAQSIYEDMGYEVVFIPSDSKGLVDLEAFYSLYDSSVVWVSVMLVNNEIGSRQPVEAIGAFLENTDTFFHVDAIQALGKITIDNTAIKADAMSFSAHKIYGPKGLGILYLKHTIKWVPLVPEATLNTPYILGFGEALRLIEHEKEAERPRLMALKKQMIEGLVALDLGITPVGDCSSEIGIVTLMFENRSSDALLIQYDFKGIALSAGSACSSGAISASPVLLAMGLDEKSAKSCIRFSIGHYTTTSDIEVVLETTKSLLKK